MAAPTTMQSEAMRRSGAHGEGRYRGGAGAVRRTGVGDRLRRPSAFRTGDRRLLHASLLGRHRGVQHPARGRLPQGQRVHRADDRAERQAARTGTRLRGRRHRLLRRHVVPRVWTSVGQYARAAAGRSPQRDRRLEQAAPRRLRSLDERGPAPTDHVRLAVGQGLPGLAHRVLGDVDGGVRREVRPAHRWRGQRLPAP